MPIIDASANVPDIRNRVRLKIQVEIRFDNQHGFRIWSLMGSGFRLFLEWISVFSTDFVRTMDRIRLYSNFNVNLDI